jgi:hypothetical protein
MKPIQTNSIIVQSIMHDTNISCIIKRFLIYKTTEYSTLYREQWQYSLVIHRFYSISKLKYLSTITMKCMKRICKLIQTINTYSDHMTYVKKLILKSMFAISVNMLLIFISILNHRHYRLGGKFNLKESFNVIK